MEVEIELPPMQRFLFFQFTFMLSVACCLMLGLWLAATLQVIRPGHGDRLIGQVVPAVGALAILAYFVERRGLRFKRFETKGDPKTNFCSVVVLAISRGWEIRESREHSLLVAMTPNPTPMLAWAGERVTVRFEGRQVWVNSTCDPGRRTSLASALRNPRNIATVVEAVGGRPAAD
ncbi:MAG TPA: hypothetical protein VJ600_11560 [Holophagaceae bacterium]|nr:hypothetical protein [Holophagaceae bacterium]